MRILIINTCCGESTGNICTDLAIALDNLGHTVKIAYGREPTPERSRKYAVRIGSNADLYLHVLKSRLLDSCGFESKKVTEEFLQWVREYDPDIIHLHNLHGYYLDIEGLFRYLRTCGKRIFWTLHDSWNFTGHSPYCDTVPCTKWIDGCSRCPHRKDYPYSLIDRSRRNWEKKKALFTGIPNLEIITPSQWLGDMVKQSMLKDYPLHVIPNGIDTSLFHPLPDDFRRHFGIGGKHLIAVDADSPEQILPLASQLAEDCCFVLPGCKAAGSLPKNVLCLPTNSNKELESIFRNADAILQCSGSPRFAAFYPVDISVLTAATPEKLRKLPIPAALMDAPGFWARKAELGLVGKEIVLGATSVWNTLKGLDDFGKLPALLPEQKIIMVGLNRQQLSKMNPAILGVPRTDSVGQLAEYYSIADYFLNLTYLDTYPTTNLEAICCGTPVITYRTGGSPESAEHFGTCIPRGDLPTAAECIKAHPRFSLHSHDFDKSTAMKQYLGIYSVD